MERKGNNLRNILEERKQKEADNPEVFNFNSLIQQHSILSRIKPRRDQEPVFKASVKDGILARVKPSYQNSGYMLHNDFKDELIEEF